MTIKQRLSAWCLGLMGWKLLPHPQGSEEAPRTVICVAPHTSNMDFIIGKLFYNATGKPSGFLMKKSWFFFPLGYLLRAMGGVPVNRSRKEDSVRTLANFIQEQAEIHIAITPEGTRSLTERWHTGFYRIAQEAGIPIELAVIDYKLREVGIFEVFYPTGDMEADIATIQRKYKGEQACYPEKYHEYN